MQVSSLYTPQPSARDRRLVDVGVSGDDGADTDNDHRSSDAFTLRPVASGLSVPPYETTECGGVVCLIENIQTSIIIEPSVVPTRSNYGSVRG
jgi:hypothetical protein